MDDARVRALEPGDAPALVALRREALTSSPLAFAASVEDDRVLSIEFVRTALADAASSAVFGAFDSTALIGMVGVHRPDKVKMRHKAIEGTDCRAVFRSDGGGGGRGRGRG
jgi:hypothetical protein